MGIQYNTHEPMLELIMVPWVVVTPNSVEGVQILKNDEGHNLKQPQKIPP